MGSPPASSAPPRDVTPDTTAALAQVRRELDYIERAVQPFTGERFPRPYLCALAAMGYVVGHVSAPAYGYLRERNEPLPAGADPSALTDATLASGAGLCGHASHAMLTLLSRLGVRGRVLTIHFSTPTAPKNGHCAVEVFYNRRWHLFDPTWGRLYRRPRSKPWQVLSAVSVLKMRPEERAGCVLSHQTLVWAQVVRGCHPLGVETGFDVFDLPHLRLDVDGKTVYSR